MMDCCLVMDLRNHLFVNVPDRRDVAEMWILGKLGPGCFAAWMLVAWMDTRCYMDACVMGRFL